MKFVEIYKLQNDGSQKVIAVCKLTDGGVVIESENKEFAHSLADRGVRDYLSNSDVMLFPKDGIKFLEQLKYNFRSGYLNASEVIEG